MKNCRYSCSCKNDIKIDLIEKLLKLTNAEYDKLIKDPIDDFEVVLEKGQKVLKYHIEKKQQKKNKEHKEGKTDCAPIKCHH